MRLVLDARTASLAALIDYAGLLPPTSLDMDIAVAAYRDARSCEASWVTGRFLCPASRLEELAHVLIRSITFGEDPWEVGVLFDGEPGEAASLTQSFHAEMQPAALVASAEVSIRDAAHDAIGRLVDAIVSVQPEIVPFLNVNAASRLSDQVAVTAEVLRARGRVGGVTLHCNGTPPDTFPDSFDLASFIVEATTAELPFRSSSGLHRPVGHFDADLGAWRHGFVNVLVAAGAAAIGHPHELVVRIIEETDASAFAIGVATASWRDVSIPGAAMRSMRARGFVGFPACDLTTPIEALDDLSFLGQGT